MRYSTLFLALLLAACALQKPTSQVTVPKTGSGDSEFVEEVFEEEGASSLPEVTKDFGERLTENGLLEVGDADAPVTLMLFTEHHCSYCKEFSIEHLPRLTEDFISHGTLKLQIGILPLKKYLDSDMGAIALYCGTAQGKGLILHQKLFELTKFDAATITAEAKKLGLDEKQFSDCLKTDEAKILPERVLTLAQELDVTLVPTYFINDKKSVGLPYYPDLRGAVEVKL